MELRIPARAGRGDPEGARTLRLPHVLSHGCPSAREGHGVAVRKFLLTGGGQPVLFCR